MVIQTLTKKSYARYVLPFVLIVPNYLEAAYTCEQPIATVTSSQGTVEVQPAGVSFRQKITTKDPLCDGDTVYTSKSARATIHYNTGAVVTFGQHSGGTVEAAKEKDMWLVRILKGTAFFRSRKTEHFNVQTKFLNGIHKGTEFLVSVDDTSTEISVLDGQVVGENSAGKITIDQGFKGIATANAAPQLQALKITPEDAVQWALYYPPLIDYTQSGAIANNPLNPALAAYQHGDVTQALTKLEAIPASQHNSAYLTLKAALLLTVGQVAEAQTLIDQIQQREPNNTDAFALQAVIAVAKNYQQKALDLANKAVTANPKSATALIAQSYAYQALFNIDEALKATVAAIQITPTNALAWARLAELQLSKGDSDAALESAQKAQSLNPNIARTQTIRGFADLAQTDIAAAKHAFEQALSLDSSDPLARLGLGLAKIRTGDLEAGKNDLETAVNLDPNNAVIRSYLGKAYYELRNKDYAGTEFKIAKDMDPKDPTPWFYDAILKQTTNRPVEALRDMQKAIELNDNRAVYRSKLLLDQDRAIRGTSISRIFNTLGLEKRGLVEASKSLTIDPSDYSSHRFLSDTYVNIPRQRIAQVSELLQAQLLQPLNINPIQPHLSVTGLGSISGINPAETGFKDFTQVFERDRPQLTTTGLVGNKNTYSDEAVLSGIYKKLSYSFGQFHYETDGFRPNADINQNIYDAFVQIAVTDKLNLQFEHRNQAIDQGDQTLSFDNNKSPERQKLNQETTRGGLHWSITPQSDLIASIVYNKRKEGFTTQNDSESLNKRDSRNGYTGELQYINRHDLGNFVIGGGAYNFDGKYIEIHKPIFDQDLCMIEPDICKDPPPIDLSPEFSGHNAYAYTNFKIIENLTATAGVSYDNYSRTSPNIDINRINPKFGLQWDITNSIRFRVAYFQTLKRLLAADQTIEPTQVAGFNQFYDDLNGTKADFFGIALDGRKSSDLYGGVEYNHKKLKLLSAQTGDVVNFYNHIEEKYRGYLYWSPISQLALAIDIQHEKQEGFLLNLRTTSLPLLIKYFNPNGFFSDIKTTFVWQENITKKQEEDFFVVDTIVGYRLPKRWGILSFEVRNLFNQHFKYEDLSSISSDQFSIYRPFMPERTFLAKFTLNF